MLSTPQIEAQTITFQPGLRPMLSIKNKSREMLGVVLEHLIVFMQFAYIVVTR